MPYQDQAKWILFPVSFLWMELKFNTWISDHDILSKVHEFHRPYASSSGLSNTILHEFKDNEPPIPCLYIDVNLCYVEILIFQVDMFTLGFWVLSFDWLCLKCREIFAFMVVHLVQKCWNFLPANTWFSCQKLEIEIHTDSTLYYTTAKHLH